MSILKKESHSRSAIARSAVWIGAGILLSRILGFARDIIIARMFGVYVLAQAFVIAFKIPNLFRDLVGEGAASAAVVPILSRYLSQDRRKDFWEAAAGMARSLLIVLTCLTAVGIIASPLLIKAIAPGFSGDTFAAAVTLNRLVFPYILLIGMAAFSTGVLNTLGHFIVPAFAPCLLNVSIIIFALTLGEGIPGLAVGVLVGGVLQLAIQLPVLFKKGFNIRAEGPEGRAAVTEAGKLLLPRLFSSAVYHLNNIVDSIFGSLTFIVGEGGVAALYFSYRLIQFPIGIFGNSLSQAILPAMSVCAGQGDCEGLSANISFGLKSTLAIMLPASVGLMILSGPIVRALFLGGRFDAYAAQLTSGALFFYSIGLTAYAGTKILQCAFFALKDTSTPAKVSAFNLCVNAGLNALLMFPLKLNGLALATSVTGILHFFVLFFLMRKKARINFKGLSSFALRVGAASAAMAGIIALVLRGSTGGALRTVFLPIAAGAISYIFFCVILKIREVTAVLSGKAFASGKI